MELFVPRDRTNGGLDESGNPTSMSHESGDVLFIGWRDSKLMKRMFGLLAGGGGGPGLGAGGREEERKRWGVGGGMGG